MRLRKISTLIRWNDLVSGSKKKRQGVVKVNNCSLLLNNWGMLKKEEGNVTITCDKCGYTETASELRYNDAFFLSGWGLFPSARKYTHQCFKCMPKRYKMATKWAQKMFPPK